MKINIYFNKSSNIYIYIYILFVKTYLTPNGNQKPTLKSKGQKLFVFWKTYLNPIFTTYNMKINA
jgi:hypothetical protein